MEPDLPRLDRPLWIVLLLLTALLLSACGPAPASSQQPFRAADHFQGKALELAQAVDRKDAATIQRLIKSESVNPDTIFDQASMPMVAWPIANGNLEGLRLLLDNGADPNARRIDPERTRGKYRNNALVFAAGLPDQRFLKLLLDHGGDPNTHNSNDEQLTYVAFLHVQWPNIQLLIERGADINEPVYTTDGYDTVLNWHTALGSFERAYWLLERGADPTLKIRADKDNPNYGRMPIVESIYYIPVKEEGIPWQRKCQHWLHDHGVPRTDAMGPWKEYRRKLGVATEPKGIPLL